MEHVAKSVPDLGDASQQMQVVVLYGVVDQPEVTPLAGLAEAVSDVFDEVSATQRRDLVDHAQRDVACAQIRELLSPHVVDAGPRSGFSARAFARATPP